MTHNITTSVIFTSQGRGKRWSGLVMVAVITLLALTIILLQPSHAIITYVNEDAVAFIDTSQRMDFGQMPYRDFGVPLGYVPLLIAWLATHLASGHGAYYVVQALMWLSLLPLVILPVARQPGWRGVWIALIVGALCLIPYVIAGAIAPEPDGISGYNRYGSALVFLLLAWLVGPKQRSVVDVIWLTALLLLMFFTKITFFVPSVLLICIFALALPTVLWVGAWAIASCIIFLAGLALINPIIKYYLIEVREMGRMNRQYIPYFIATQTRRCLIGIIAVSLLLYLIARGTPWNLSQIGRRPRVWLRANWVFCSIAIILVSVVLIESQSSGNAGLIAATSIFLIVFPKKLLRKKHVTMMLGAACVACSFAYAENILARGSFLLLKRVNTLQTDARFEKIMPGALIPKQLVNEADSLEYEWLSFPDAREKFWADDDYSLVIPWYVAQMRLLSDSIDVAKARHFLAPEKSAISLTVTDAARIASGTAPPLGTRIWQDSHRTYAPPTLDEARYYLRNVSVVFVPTCGINMRQEDLRRDFSPAIAVDFKKYNLAPCWETWVRKATG